MKQTPTIQTQHLQIGYLRKGKKKIVVHEDLSLALYPGEVTSLLGLNGAGKSTLIRTLCGFQPALGGEIRLMGKPLASYSQRRFSLTVGVVLTDKTAAGGLTVYDLVSLGRHPYTGFFGQLGAEDRRIIFQSLDAAGIGHKVDNYVCELSDGERQKVMIAKVLAQQCPVIILDEPTAFLDVTSRIETMVLLRRLASQQHKTILLSTHDLEQALQMSDKLWLQAQGHPMLCGAPEDLILSGAFGNFFAREDICFDPVNGKLLVRKPMRPVRVTGDALLVYWVGNALIRNGFQPSEAAAPVLEVCCHSPRRIEISDLCGQRREVASVEELVQSLVSTFPPPSPYTQS